jgi:hypothetical protein
VFKNSGHANVVADAVIPSVKASSVRFMGVPPLDNRSIGQTEPFGS